MSKQWIAKLVGDLGAIGARVYFKTYNGKRHIVLKGHAGLRTILTGSRYGIQHPKVVSMGLGKADSITAVKQGGLLSIILLTVYRVIDYLLMLVRELWFGRVVGKKLMSFCTRWALFGFFLMFAQGVHYFMEPRWLNLGYQVCELVSERSLRYSRIVYSTEEKLCNEALKLRLEKG